LGFIEVIDPYKRWSWKASKAAIKFGRRQAPHVVFSSGPPFSMLLSGTRVAKALGIPHVADFRDPWIYPPENQTSRSNFPGWLGKKAEFWVVSRAASVTLTTSALQEALSSRYPDFAEKMVLIRNGFDSDPGTAKVDSGGELRMLFAGELYANRDPFPLLEALEGLCAKPEVDARKVGLLLMGECDTYKGRSIRNWLRGKVAERIVTILPRQPKHRVDEAIQKSTLLVNFSQNQPYSIPAKTFEQLASGREILILAERGCEVDRLVSGIDGVTVVDAQATGSLDSFLLDAYQRHVLGCELRPPSRTDVAKFSRALANERFLRLFHDLSS
jgi:glycosyltransferase involved in cell wall biosynthesis